MDAFKSGKEIAQEDLPAPMQSMSPGEQQAYVAELAQARDAISRAIGQLADERREYLRAAAAAAGADNQPAGLESALVEQVKEIAEAEGFVFE